MMDSETFWRNLIYTTILLVSVVQCSYCLDNESSVTSSNGDPNSRATRSLDTDSDEDLPNSNVRYLCLESEDDVSRTVKHLGTKCVCPSIYAPVCGSDNITYHNRCFMQCRSTQSQEKYNRYAIKLRVKHFGECRSRHGRHNIHQSSFS